MAFFEPDITILTQLARQGLEFDQKMKRALEVSASKPNLDPEDNGFPDSYLTLALYRLNSTLTRLVSLDDSRFNLFHEYKLAPPCSAEAVTPGERLCLVLTEAVRLASPKKTIGTGHFLRAIASITHEFGEEPSPGFENQVLHSTFSIETLMWGLGYNAWTPLSQAPQIQDVLQAIAGREPIDDFQYLMTFEEGRIVFRPTSILNPYLMEESSGTARSRLAVLTHFKDQYASLTPSEILELEDLINDLKVKENEIQHFFENHPQLFRLWDYRDVYPHVYLTRKEDGPLVPDFILVDHELQKSMILDLKLPKAKMIRKQRNRSRFSTAIEEARAQLLEYRDWLGVIAPFREFNG